MESLSGVGTGLISVAIVHISNDNKRIAKLAVSHAMSISSFRCLPFTLIRSFKQATEFDGDGGKDKTQAEEEASSSPAPKGVTGGVAPGLGETQGQVLRPVEPITPPKDLPGGVPNPPSGVYTPP